MLNRSNINTVWASLLIEGLIRQGVDHFFIAPGSRSTPLTVAIAQHPKAQTVIHFDERGSAFAAIGFARATGKPAVWVTTSGTAVANGLPAVIEAHNDLVPLLCITADRPPELQATSANQTIAQSHIFGQYPRWQLTLPCPTIEISPSYLLTTVHQAVARTLSPKGAVHLNIAFREPLAPEIATIDFTEYLAPITSWLSQEEPYTEYPKPERIVSKAVLENLATHCAKANHGIIIAGKSDNPEEAWAILALAEALNFAVFPDIGSPLRFLKHPHVIAYFDLLLQVDSFQHHFTPDVVLQIGSRFTSKRLLQALAHAHPAHYVVVQEHPFRSDPNHQVSQILEATPTTFCNALSTMASRNNIPSSFLRTWQSVESLTENFFQEVFQSDELTEPKVAHTISQRLPATHGLFLSNSMPIRDMDMFAQTRSTEILLHLTANRGASGIDGVLSSAIGFALGSQKPTTLVVGDLAFLHDLNALALLKHHRLPLTIVLLNNNGGGIFSFLPIAKEQAIFEKYFGTPHHITFQQAAYLFGLHYEQPTTAATFEESYQRAIAQDAPTLIEVQTLRGLNHYEHQKLTGKLQQFF